MILLVILISIILGYALRIHHEAKIQKSYQSQAEKELTTLEEEFHSALKKPHKFLIFNGRFEVYPVKESDRTFYYRELKDDNLVEREARVTNSMQNNDQE